ncbi:MAG TPA: aminopeptidase P family protein [Pseudolysinimonas sp.]|nr:aminopeptidase P family protein [Pseudolysinimonas sp.]
MADTSSNRSTIPSSPTFADFIAGGWAEHDDTAPAPRSAAEHANRRRMDLASRHPDSVLIIPAGPLRVRSNDTDYPYRPHSAFAHLTGWGSDAVPNSVLVIDTRNMDTRSIDTSGADEVSTLFFRPTAGRDSDEFYANSAIGEFWTGPRPSLANVAADLGLPTRPLSELAPTLETLVESAPLVIVRSADSELAAQVDRLRDGDDTDPDTALERAVSELRLVKDPWEVEQLRQAVDATRQGFEDVIRDLPQIVAHARGERLVEGTFNRRARAEGNHVGYDTIAASGAHACILHWTRNDGAVRAGDLILVDAGVEIDSLYTADITRTLPVSGTFSPVQRRVYETVREAADAAFAIVRPGIRFREVHAAAMAVIATRTAEWGFLPVSALESLEPDAQYHRRYMVHGTSHHLGLDVHDCAQARRDLYLDGVLEAGMVFTIEPGLYFQPDDLTVPAEYRGIGIRIEDDIVVTDSGAESLSSGIPRTADEVEAWIAELSA